MSKVNILGTEYEFSEDMKDDSCDGMTDVYAKTMQIKPKDKFFDDEDGKANDARRDEVIIHEICHAFFFESGLRTTATMRLLLVGWASRYRKSSLR